MLSIAVFCLALGGVVCTINIILLIFKIKKNEVSKDITKIFILTFVSVFLFVLGSALHQVQGRGFEQRPGRGAKVRAPWAQCRGLRARCTGPAFPGARQRAHGGWAGQDAQGPGR